MAGVSRAELSERAGAAHKTARYEEGAGGWLPGNGFEIFDSGPDFAEAELDWMDVSDDVPTIVTAFFDRDLGAWLRGHRVEESGDSFYELPGDEPETVDGLQTPPWLVARPSLDELLAVLAVRFAAALAVALDEEALTVGPVSTSQPEPTAPEPEHDPPPVLQLTKALTAAPSAPPRRRGAAARPLAA